jgi:hypothetical protein
LQGLTLFLGAIASILLTQKIARQPLRGLLPQHAAIAFFGISLWQVIV